MNFIGLHKYVYRGLHKNLSRSPLLRPSYIQIRRTGVKGGEQDPGQKYSGVFKCMRRAMRKR